MRRGLLVAVVLAIGGAVGSSALPSCNGPPDKTCFADHVTALEDAGQSRECAACLQSKGAPHACCDVVGACDEDPQKVCVPSFRATQRCVLDGGPSVEPRCKSLLGNDRARSLYSCMRSNCGAECGVPSCNLDPSVSLFGSPTCDGCMGGACCDTLNSCTRDRRCKLVMDCITSHCPLTLGAVMTTLGGVSPDARRAAKDSVCAGGALTGAECVDRCLDDLAPGGDGSTIDDRASRCLAVGVLTCGAEASCGPRCSSSEDGGYADDPSGTTDASALDAKAP